MSAAAPRQHPDPVDVVLALDPVLASSDGAAAGEPAATTRRAVLEHLDRCGDCGALAAALLAVPPLLAADDPGPVPDDVALRLDAALRAEVHGRTTRDEAAGAPADGAGAVPHGPGLESGELHDHGRSGDADVVPLPSGRSARATQRGAPSRREARQDDRALARAGLLSRAPRALAALAAAAVVVAGVAVGASVVGDDEGSTSAGGAASDAGGATELAVDAVPVVATGTDYRTQGLPQLVQGLLDVRDDPAALRSAEAQVEAGTQADDAGGAASTATTGTDQESAPEPAPGAPQAAPTADEPLASDDGIAACVDSLGAPRGTRPVVVDLSTWEGRAAALVLLPTRDGAGVEVWAVPRTCGAEDAEVLHYETVVLP